MTLQDASYSAGSDSPLGPRTGLSRSRFFLSNEFGLILLIVIFAIIFGFATRGFFSPFNMFALGRNSAVNIMIGLSMMSVIVTGGLNLAVGAMGVCAAMARDGGSADATAHQ